MYNPYGMESYLEQFGNYTINLTGSGVRFLKKGLFGRYVDVRDPIGFSSLGRLRANKDEILEEIETRTKDEEDISIKGMYSYVSNLIQDDSYYLKLIPDDKPMLKLDLICSDFYIRHVICDVFFSSEQEKLANEWRKKVLLQILPEIEFSELFERKRDYSSINVGAFYLNELLSLGIPEVNDWIFEDEEFQENFINMCEREEYTFSSQTNVLSTLLTQPESFNKHVEKLGPLENFVFKPFSSCELTALDILFDTEDLILSKIDLTHFEKCKITGEADVGDASYVQFVWKNIFYYVNKDLCIQNLRDFFNFTNKFNKEVELNLEYSGKSLLSYAVDECNKEMVSILMENGADPKYKYSDSKNSTLHDKVASKKEFYDWFLSKESQVV